MILKLITCFLTVVFVRLVYNLVREIIRNKKSKNLSSSTGDIVREDRYHSLQNQLEEQKVSIPPSATFYTAAPSARPEPNTEPVPQWSNTLREEEEEARKRFHRDLVLSAISVVSESALTVSSDDSPPSSPEPDTSPTTDNSPEPSSPDFEPGGGDMGGGGASGDW